jgi:hypothetical protein
MNDCELEGSTESQQEKENVDDSSAKMNHHSENLMPSGIVKSTDMKYCETNSSVMV